MHPAHSNYTGGGNGEAVFMPYAIAGKNAKEKKAVHPIRLGQWRSVLNSRICSRGVGLKK